MILIRVSAWIHRFIRRLKREKTSTGPLTSKELEEARILRIKTIQNQSYRDVNNALTEKKKHNLVNSWD